MIEEERKQPGANTAGPGDEMKKITLIRLALVMALMLSVSAFMCSCGGGSESESADEPEGSGELTLEEYFEENPQDLQDIIDGAKNDEDMQEALEYMDFDVYAEGNTLYYDYQFKETFDEDKAAQAAEALADSMDENEAIMVSKIDPIETGFGVKDITVHMIYRNGDGTVLAERDYTK